MRGRKEKEDKAREKRVGNKIETSARRFFFSSSATTNERKSDSCVGSPSPRGTLPADRSPFLSHRRVDSVPERTLGLRLRRGRRYCDGGERVSVCRFFPFFSPERREEKARDTTTPPTKALTARSPTLLAPSFRPKRDGGVSLTSTGMRLPLWARRRRGSRGRKRAFSTLFGGSLGATTAAASERNEKKKGQPRPLCPLRPAPSHLSTPSLTLFFFFVFSLFLIKNFTGARPHARARCGHAPEDLPAHPRRPEAGAEGSRAVAGNDFFYFFF